MLGAHDAAPLAQQLRARCADLCRTASAVRRRLCVANVGHPRTQATSPTVPVTVAQRFLHGLGIGLGLSLHCRPPALPYRNAHVRSAKADRRAPTGAPTAVRAVLCDGQRKASGRDHDMACRVDHAGGGCVGADGRDQVPKPRGAVALLLCARRLGRRAPRARAYAQPHTRDGAVGSVRP